MRFLVILVAVSCCSAQLVLPHVAPWVLPTAKLIADVPEADETEVKPLALPSPYFYPYGHSIFSPFLPPITTDPEVKPVAVSAPYIHPLITPYFHPNEAKTNAKIVTVFVPYIHPSSHPLITPYSLPTKDKSKVKPSAVSPHIFLPDLPSLSGYFGFSRAHHIPKIAAAAAATQEASLSRRRRRREVTVPLPYLQAVPTTKEFIVETKQFEATDDATPADTTLIKLTTKEQEISIPAVKYVQPHVNLKSVTYTAVSPAAILPYHAAAAAVAPAVVAPAIVPYHSALSPAVLPYSRFPYHAAYHGFHYPALAHAPVVKIEE